MCACITLTNCSNPTHRSLLHLLLLRRRRRRLFLVLLIRVILTLLSHSFVFVPRSLTGKTSSQHVRSRRLRRFVFHDIGDLTAPPQYLLSWLDQVRARPYLTPSLGLGQPDPHVNSHANHHAKHHARHLTKLEQLNLQQFPLCLL